MGEKRSGDFFFKKRVNFEKDATLNLAHAVGLHDFSRLIEVNWNVSFQEGCPRLAG